MDSELRNLLDIYLSDRGFAVTQADSRADALHWLESLPIEVIVAESRFPDGPGHELLTAGRRTDPDRELVLLAESTSVREALGAIQQGAADYVERPVDCRRLHRTLQMAVERRRLRRRVRALEASRAGGIVFEGMVARGERMREVFAFVDRLSRFPTTALIVGESGTGKELVARALHARSPLKDRPFIVCNCGALAPGILESELFGHVRGAFTGADRDQKGLFESADGGTIFLDEIGELTPGAQVTLLRVLENREIRRVGSPTSIPIDIRVIAATNRDLATMVREGTFREDLFYRLNVGVVELPPLRERREDLDLLCDRFLAGFAQRTGIDRPRVTPATLEVLSRHRWPGNVRELGNVLERAVIMARGGDIEPEHLPREILAATSGTNTSGLASIEAALTENDLTLRSAERDQIRRALDSAGGKRVAAARLLGLSRRTLYRKLDKYGIR